MQKLVNLKNQKLIADNKKARRLLDWAPKFAGISGLKRGLEATAHWFSRPENLEVYKPEIYNV